MSVLRIGLCEGRHDIVDGENEVTTFVFSEAITDPHDFAGMREHALAFWTDLLNRESAGEEPIHLFVTGLTSALVATIQAYTDFPYAPALVLRHFDRNTNGYTEQAWS